MSNNKLTPEEVAYLTSPAFPESVAVCITESGSNAKIRSNYEGLSKIEWVSATIETEKMSIAERVDLAEKLLLTIKNRYKTNE